MKLILKLSEVSMLRASIFGLRLWDFEKEDSIKRVSKKVQDSSELEVLGSRLSESWSDCLIKNNVDRTSPWVKEHVASFANFSCEIELSKREQEYSNLALEVCEIEFRNNHIDFFVALPGFVDWYGKSPADLPALAEKLKRG